MLILGLMSYKEFLITCLNCTCRLIYIFYEVTNECVGKSRVCNDDNKWFWDVVTRILLKSFCYRCYTLISFALCTLNSLETNCKTCSNPKNNNENALIY